MSFVAPVPQLHEKVEMHRQRRDAFFSKIDGQTDGDTRAVANAGTSDPARLAIRMMDYDPQQLLALLREGEVDLAVVLHCIY